MKSYQLDQEADKETSKFPRSVGFIVGNEFCERFSYYGMRGQFSMIIFRPKNSIL